MVALPLVSIVLPTYNRERYLREALDSVFAQTYPRWELIIVDDGSTDGTRSYLETLRDARIRSVLRAHCGNAARLRNVAIAESAGLYVAFLDSDDLWSPDKLAAQIDALRAHAECRWSYTGFALIDAGGGALVRPGARRAPPGGWMLEEIVDGAPVALPGVLVERSFLQTLGGFDEGLVIGEDLDLWIRLAEASPVTVVSRHLVQVRLHAGNHRVPLLAALACRKSIYERLRSRATSPRIRRLCERRLARFSLEVAGAARRGGQDAEAMTALRAAFPYAGWQPRWWVALAKTWLRPRLPRGLVSLYERITT